MRGRISFFTAISLFLLVIGSVIVFAHSAGGGQDITVGTYLIDFGYSEYEPLEGEFLLLSFLLANKDTKQPVSFTKIWTIILDEDDNLIFSSSIAQDIVGEAALGYVFQNDGEYIIRVKFQNGFTTLAETEFSLEILKDSDKTSKAEPKPRKEKLIKTINIEDESFEPDFIKIPVGTTVTWVSKSSILHWPATNYHPLHNQYPGSGINKCEV